MYFSSFVFPAEKMWQTFVASFKVAKTSAQQSLQQFQPLHQIHSSRREQPYNSLHDHLQRIAHQHVQLMLYPLYPCTNKQIFLEVQRVKSTFYLVSLTSFLNKNLKVVLLRANSEVKRVAFHFYLGLQPMKLRLVVRRKCFRKHL